MKEKTRQVDFDNKLLEDALHQINSPLILVDRFFKVLFISVQTELLVEQNSLLFIRQNRFSFAGTLLNEKLNRLVHMATCSDDLTESKYGGAM